MNLMNSGAIAVDEPLIAGQTVTRTELVTLPRTTGLFRFFVETDTRNAVIETDEIDNISFSDPLQINLRPRPDLRVTGVTAPGSDHGGHDHRCRVYSIQSWVPPTLRRAAAVGTIASTFHRHPAAPAARSCWVSCKTVRHSVLSAQRVVSQLNTDQRDRSWSHDRSPAIGSCSSTPTHAVKSMSFPPRTTTGPHRRSRSMPIQCRHPTWSLNRSMARAMCLTIPPFTVRYQVANLGAGVTDPGSWTDQIWLTLGERRTERRTWGHLYRHGWPFRSSGSRRIV